jgi:hypothetical protein
MSGTFWLDESTDVRYYERRAFSYGEGEDRINYTKTGATPETFAGLGFVQVQIEARPDDRFYWVNGPDHTGAYTATPKRLEDEPAVDEDGDPILDSEGNQVINYGLKTEWEKKQDTDQFGLLSGSDWMVTRKADTGIDLKEEWQQYRDDVRLTNPLRQDQISQVTTVPELEALVTNPAEVPVDPDDPSKGMKPNPEPHLIPWPVSPDAQQA